MDLPPWLLSALGAPAHSSVFVPVDEAPSGSRARRLAGAPTVAAFFEARLNGTDLAGILRLAPIAGAPDREAFARGLGARALEWSILGDGLTPTPGMPRAFWPLPKQPAVIPPLLRCREKQVWIGAVCPGCAGPAAAEGSRCPACGSPESAPNPAAVADPIQSLWHAVRDGGVTEAASTCIPCLVCDRKDACYPAAGPPTGAGTAAEILETVSGAPSSAVLLAAPQLSWGDWLALVSREGAPPRGDLRTGPALVLGPEHGERAGLESFLLRLDTLAQLLRAVRRLSGEYGVPHLALTPSSIWFATAAREPWRPALWSTRLALLEWAPGLRSGDPASAVPPDDRPASLVPPGCVGALDWTEGRCLPGGGGADPSALPRWDIKFLPNEAVDPPQMGAVVEFGPVAGGPETPGTVPGRVDVAFQEVWSISVDSPGKHADAIRDLLGRDHGRPMIRVRAVSDHALADDLFAIGTLWLALLSENGLDLDAVARFRERLRASIEADDEPARRRKLSEAAVSDPELRYRPAGDARARCIPETWLVQALEWAARAAGLYPGAYPGQDHAPTTAAERAATFDELLSEAEDLSVSVRDAIFGASPEDAEIRAALERFVADAG